MPQDQDSQQASEATDTNLPKSGSGKPSAPTAALLGTDTRPSIRLNGLDGKALKVPKLEETLYLISCELTLIRMELKQARLEAKARGGR